MISIIIIIIINFASDPSIFFFSVFNVIDHNGNKIRDKEVIDYIQRVGFCMLEFFKYFN